jgi:hypothetical protein
MDAHCEKINAIYVEMRADMNAYYDRQKARLDARREEMRADREEMMAGLKEIFKAITGASWESTEAREEKVKALPETTEACPGVTPARLEKKEPTPEETEAVAVTEEVPVRATEQESVEAAEDRTGDLRLAARRRRQRRKWAQENGGPRQKFAAFRGQVTRRAVPALLKGHVRKGPRRNRQSGVKGPGRTSGSRIGNRGLTERRTKDKAVRGTPGKRTCERNRRTRPVFGNGLRDQGERQSTLVRNGMTFCEAIRQRLDVKIAKFIFEPYIRLREPGDWKLWKCRPPPKRKR